MSILKIDNSKYSIEYEEGREWDYSVKRCNEDVSQDLKLNIVSDMFYMILAQNEKLETVKQGMERMMQEGISAGTIQDEYFKRGVMTVLCMMNEYMNNDTHPDSLTTQKWYDKALNKSAETNLAELPDGTYFYVENGAWYGYADSDSNGNKVIYCGADRENPTEEYVRKMVLKPGDRHECIIVIEN